MPIEPDYPVNPGPLTLLRESVLRGANYFSGGPVAVLRVDLGEYEEVFTDAIPGFYAKLRAAVPTLEEHHCSEGVHGGFFLRVDRGTLLGHVTEHVAIELQSLAGMDADYGKTRSTTEQGVYNVVFRFLDEEAGLVAGRTALNLVNAMLEDRPFDVDAAVAALVEIRERRMLGPSTQALVDEAARRGIPWLRMDEYNLVQIGTGRHARRLRATITSHTRALAVDTVDDKLLTASMLADAGVPVPDTRRVVDVDEAAAFQRRLGAPIVLKPRSGQLGRGVTVGARGPQEIARAFALAEAEGEGEVLAQPLVEGDTFRLLVVDRRVVAAARLRPPAVIGVGERTVAELVDELNRDPLRQVGDKTPLTVIEIDEQTLRLLAEEGLAPESVLEAGRRVALQVSPSLRLGGAAADVTDQVHPDTLFMAERAARVLDLDVAGVDVIARDLGRPLADSGGVVVEVNAAPDLRPHLLPVEGEPRAVARPIVDWLLPEGGPVRIPILSVTGTAGKTITANLLAHCLRREGQVTGLTTTDGLFIGDRCLLRGDMTFPEQVTLVLTDPTVDCAVLETSREGILRRGLGYEWADVGIVLNVHDDHVGADDITRLDDLAYAKSVVAEQVYEGGAAVLNADQELVLEMAGRSGGRLVLFTADPDNQAVAEHVAGGGTAVMLEGDLIVVAAGAERRDVAAVADIPLLLGGKARLMLDNVLAAVGALLANGLSFDAVRRGLMSFRPDPHTLPGRMNLIDLRRGRVLLDYAHNPAGFRGLADLLRHFGERKAAALDAAGDRADEEIVELGRLAGETYDELFLYEDPDRRGRGRAETLILLQQGVASSGFPAESCRLCDTPRAAWLAALERCGPDAMAVILTERSHAALELIEAFDAGRLDRGKR